MTLTEMREILKARDLQLTKSLGQNFLHDGNQLRRIVAAAELSATDQVLEIGPGLGPLTELLLASGASVLAIEKDGRLCTFLRERFANEPSFTLLHDDALAYLQRRAGDLQSPFDVPYSVASPILVELALHPRGPERMVVTLQHEVARRIAAAPDTDDYGLLTLLLGLRYQPGGLFKIPASCFFPAPDVESACITLSRREPPLLDERQAEVFVRIVKRAFSQRRKMMFKLLKTDWPEDQLQAAFATLGISPQERAEKVSLEVFTDFCRLLGT
ncbi:MAG: Ribosomal RNA small subunit methyltransferase A [Limisphaerales bacterium]|nr:MAG: Ribosomal RNA small subunit methyltransferase A [Limisphaerales bacterium]KAG0509662.1 MAG: Ribosomal RNA small subunit methyltransferase A [Limisphaerales bacterium]